MKMYKIALITILCFNCIVAMTQTTTDVERLVKNVLLWSDTTSIDLLPVIKKGNIYNGIDTIMVNQGIIQMQKTNLFSEQFIDNYKKLIYTINERLHNRYYDDWLVGDLPTFSFANDLNPWCNCQGYYADHIDIGITKENQNNAETIYRITIPYDFEFTVRIINQNGQWKISYLSGFDYEAGIKKDVRE